MFFFLDEHNKNNSFEWVLVENGLGPLGVNLVIPNLMKN